MPDTGVSDDRHLLVGQQNPMASQLAASIVASSESLTFTHTSNSGWWQSFHFNTEGIRDIIVVSLSIVSSWTGGSITFESYTGSQPLKVSLISCISPLPVRIFGGRLSGRLRIGRQSKCLVGFVSLRDGVKQKLTGGLNYTASHF